MILKFSHTLLFLLISINLWPQTPPQFDHFKIDVDAPRISFFDAIENVEIIRFEETDHSLLPKIEWYFETPLGIAVPIAEINKPNSIPLFDPKGNYLGVIEKEGPGPEEYKNITDAWFHEGVIELYSSFSRNLQRYTPQGQYIETKWFKEKVFGKSMTPYQNGYLFHQRNSAQLGKESFYHELAFMDKNLGVKKWAAPRSKINPNPFNLGWNFSSLGEEIFYRKPLRDTVYQIIGQKLYPRFKFDFGDKWVWNEPNSTENLNKGIKLMLDTEKVIEVLSTISEQYIFLTYIHYEDRIGKFSKGYINRKSSEFFRFDLRKKDKSNFELEFLKRDGERLAASLAAYDFEEFIENLDEDQWTVRGGFKIREILYSENPVLLKIKFKDSLR